MLIEYGNTVVVPHWELNEHTPTGYSRIYYVIAGEATYEAEDVRRSLKPGYIYALPSTLPYRVFRNKRMDFQCTYLHVNFFQSHIDGLIEMKVEEDSCLSRYIRAVQAAINEERVRLLEQMADAFAEFLRGHPFFSDASEMQNTVQDYISQHMSENLTVERLSALFSYHPNYFIRLFRQETGYTPYQFILQQRMQYAVVQLNKGLPNEDVCYICGYTDASTFTRAFRKYYGVTPQKYKKGYRKP